MLEIHILSGVRAGHFERLENPKTTIGRHAASTLRFDPHGDLDVSGRHAEVHLVDGKYFLRDVGSTNGTYVNGKRIEPGENVEIHDGDKLRFGGKGPEAEVRAPAIARSTEQRIAIAVNQQTAGFKRYTVGSLALLVIAGFVAYWMGRRSSQQSVEELRQMLASNESKIAILQGESGDTALANEVERRTKVLRERLAGATTDAERTQIRNEISELERQSSSMVRMDLTTINQANAPAVAIIVSEIAGKSFAGSGFAIAPQGVLMTNRHNVENDAGERASRIAVKFKDTGEWLPAHIVKVANDNEGDLALIQIDIAGKALPTVSGVQSNGDHAAEGAPVAIIGFPLGFSIAMEGEGNDFIAKSTLNPGTISKLTSTILQIDSFAAHGSSGSPVLNARGFVIGVVYGGPEQGAGRIVYAVPADKIAAFIPSEYRGIVRN
jgi:pSer/pThr/pTyr-binding forkhead associated (FHA) protein/V8-like Glu-specific endopeptidase